MKLINQEVNVWYKLCCYYQATTELYDRKLTDLRSPYDSTEAYIINENRRWSTIFRVEQRRRIMEIAAVLEIPKSIIEENGIRCSCNFSAQGWIDQYEHLVNIGEMDFMNNIKN